MKTDKKDDTPVPGHQEAIHRTRVLASLVEEQLLGHPALASNFFWRNKAEQALDALGDLAAALEAEAPRRRMAEAAEAPAGRAQASGGMAVPRAGF
ncbi:hypothetical protein [Roseomonas gilardii]|uniref:hypothetical protein n=1 Tax=Roseomonas gilardii TaxID=257708 RepID=UPI00048430FD|nr:hypothetical protein [Roseomonas gilardii]SUE43480.1 Uncharacterised protein [Roseomonas gilardii subsp. rosea]